VKERDAAREYIRFIEKYTRVETVGERGSERERRNERERGIAKERDATREREIQRE